VSGVRCPWSSTPPEVSSTTPGHPDTTTTVNTTHYVVQDHTTPYVAQHTQKLLCWPAKITLYHLTITRNFNQAEINHQ
jgi:hypothetical protein